MKYNNTIGFLDMLFCITMSFMALFVLAIIQINEIEVTVEEFQSVQEERNNLLTSQEEMENLNSQLQKELEQTSTALENTHQEIENQKQLLNSAEEATKTEKERADLLASKQEELEQEVAKLRGMGNWRSTAKIAIEVSWPKRGNGEHDDDIDIYIKAPDKSVTYFRDQIGPGLLIDRDDLGNAEVQDQHVEVTQFFKLLETTNDRSYVVNLHVYKKRTQTPTPVNFKLYLISETDAEVVYEKTFNLKNENQVQPVIEIFTKKSQQNREDFMYSSYKETTKNISSSR